MSPPPHLIRTDFWFNDGNIILIAQNAAFKVHKGQLARHSEVFADLFSLPQPTLDKCLVDGCPTVVLQDSPSDVFYFLSALYDGLYFTPSRARSKHHPPVFPSLSAVLRLSTKYLVDPLVQRCLFHLHLDWPTSLSAWDEREARFTLHPPCPSEPLVGRKCVDGRYVPRAFCPHPILIIHFAQEMNLPDILPAAMYDLSRYGPSKIMHGATPSPTAFDLFVSQLSDRPSPAPKPVRLSRELLCQTLRGREETQRFLASFIEKELSSRPPSPSCRNLGPAAPPSTPPAPGDPSPTPYPVRTHNNPCSDAFYFLLLNILRSVAGISLGRDADALFTLTQATEMLDRTDFYVAGQSSAVGGGGAGSADGTSPVGNLALNMCQACKQDFKERVRKAREEMWSYLPRWFGLVSSETETVEI